MFGTTREFPIHARSKHKRKGTYEKQICAPRSDGRPHPYFGRQLLPANVEIYRHSNRFDSLTRVITAANAASRTIAIATATVDAADIAKATALANAGTNTVRPQVQWLLALELEHWFSARNLMFDRHGEPWP